MSSERDELAEWIEAGRRMGFKEERPYVCAQNLLFDALLAHPTITRYISEDQLAKDIYSSLTNARVILDLSKLDITEEEREEMFRSLLEDEYALDAHCSFRAAGAFVASLRNELIGTSEDYMDWYCSGPECYLSPVMAEIYEELGIKWSEWTD